MASVPKTRDGLSLDEFLRLPEIDKHPYLEYLEGKVMPKVSPQFKHSALTSGFLHALDDFAVRLGLGQAFPELRCSYAGRSIIPDLAFLLEEHIPEDESGEYLDSNPVPPDIHIEIISPRQGGSEADEKLRHSTSHGCPIGWLVHPYRRTIDEYRPGQQPRRLPDDGVLDGAPVLPGFRLPVAEVWQWMKPRRRRGDQGGPA
jgi:Uma2 family endonuclease